MHIRMRDEMNEQMRRRGGGELKAKARNVWKDATTMKSFHLAQAHYSRKSHNKQTEKRQKKI